MKKTLILMTFLVILALCILSQNTKYYFAGCIVFMMLLSCSIFKDLYKYQKRKSEVNDMYITLKRENLSWKLISGVYFSVYFAVNFLINKTTEVGPREIFMAASIIIYGIVSAYSIIWPKPILSQNGILFSNGDFINIDDINKVHVEDSQFTHDKKLSFNFNERNYILKIKNCDYENIKDFIKISDDMKLCEN